MNIKTKNRSDKRAADKSAKKSATNDYIIYEHLDKIGEIPVYYGFTPAKTPDIKKTDLEAAKNLLEGDYIDDTDHEEKLPLHVEEKTALLRMYQEQNMFDMPQPIMLYHKDPFRGSIKAVKGAGHYPRYADLEIIGTSKSIAEAMLIEAGRAMLREEGYTETGVEINSIGDRDSIARHTKDLIAYYRKHVNDMHPECRQALKRDPFELFACKNEKCIMLNEQAPKSMNYLTEISRTHFREVLEYLEALGVPYVINNHLFGNRKYCSETIFEIVNLEGSKGFASNSSDMTLSSLPATGSTTPTATTATTAPADIALAGPTSDSKSDKDAGKIKKTKGKQTLAIGVRYDGLAKRIGHKKEVPGVSLSILIKGNYPELRKELKKVKRPKVTFIQLGFEAKLLSLKVLTLLKEAKIPVYQSLSKDKIGVQFSSAEKNNTPFTMIMGKKEALENNVIVRNALTRSQETVALEDLAYYMKRLGL